jgi:hypothetical protein
MKFPIFACISIMITGLFFFMYVVINYGFHNPVDGAFTELDSQIDVTMDAEHASWTRDLLDFQHSWWGTCWVVLIIMNIVCAFVDVIRSPKQTLE